MYIITLKAKSMRNIYMYDRQTAITTRVSRGITDVTVDANGPSAAPAVSGDGNSIAFSVDEGRSSAIFVVNPDGSNTRRVTMSAR